MSGMNQLSACTISKKRLRVIGMTYKILRRLVEEMAISLAEQLDLGRQNMFGKKTNCCELSHFKTVICAA